MSDRRGLCGSRRGEIRYGATFRRVAGDNEERERGGLILYCNLDFGNFKEHALSYLNRFRNFLNSLHYIYINFLASSNRITLETLSQSAIVIFV